MPTCTGHPLTEVDLIRRWVLEQPMCKLGLALQYVNNRFGIVFEDYFAQETGELDKLRRDGLLDRSVDGFEITPLGQVFIRNIAMVFDAYLNTSEGQVLYSRTV